jgi:hypothetical protein
MRAWDRLSDYEVGDIILQAAWHWFKMHFRLMKDGGFTVPKTEVLSLSTEQRAPRELQCPINLFQLWSDTHQKEACWDAAVEITGLAKSYTSLRSEKSSLILPVVRWAKFNHLWYNLFNNNFRLLYHVFLSQNA